MKAVLVFFIVFAVFGATHYTASTNYQRGYQAAKAAGLEQIAQLKAQQSIALAHQYQTYLADLQVAQQRSATAEKQFLTDQSSLNQQLQQLQGELHEALRYQPHCSFTLRWVQHYSAALGLPTDDRNATTTTGASDATRENATAATAATLLQHAEQYGHWCRSAVNKLNALQALILQQEET